MWYNKCHLNLKNDDTKEVALEKNLRASLPQAMSEQEQRLGNSELYFRSWVIFASVTLTTSTSRLSKMPKARLIISLSSELKEILLLFYLRAFSIIITKHFEPTHCITLNLNVLCCLFIGIR